MSWEQLLVPKKMVQDIKSITKRPSPAQLIGFKGVFDNLDTVIESDQDLLLSCLLPILILAVQQEMGLQYTKDEGPFAIVVCPHRRTAEQVIQFCKQFSNTLQHYPNIYTPSLDRDLTTLPDGFHILVSYPTHLKKIMDQGLYLDLVSIVCLYDASELQDPVDFILTRFKCQKMVITQKQPYETRQLIKKYLDKPVLGDDHKPFMFKCQVQVDYIRQDKLFPSLLQALQKTSPPVLVFTQSSEQARLSEEYLLLKGIEACSVHTAKRNNDTVLKDFEKGYYDVLITTDHFNCHSYKRSQHCRTLMTLLVHKQDNPKELKKLKEILTTLSLPVPKFLSPL
ncbi:hypothetical protein EDD86DRAFT_250243 [Gorgonomyces haynaldii]|nr:hypothetical protein EDD86DRAFT_250243 [Gorgonomyces haynaldii]